MARRDTHHYDYKFSQVCRGIPMLGLGRVRVRCRNIVVTFYLLFRICQCSIVYSSLECWCGVTCQWFVSPFVINVTSESIFVCIV